MCQYKTFVGSVACLGILHTQGLHHQFKRISLLIIGFIYRVAVFLYHENKIVSHPLQLYCMIELIRNVKKIVTNYTVL